MICIVTYVIGCLFQLIYMLFFCRQSKSHRTWTKQWNPSVLISSITDNCIPAIVFSQHTRLISSNRMCYYRSSHTFSITDLFAAYHTHLLILNHFCSLVSTQTVHPSEPHVVYRTHLDLADRFFCVACMCACVRAPVQDASNATLRSETLRETVCDAIIANGGVKTRQKGAKCLR